MMKHVNRLYVTLIFIFLYAPIAIMILFSFNNQRSLAKFTGFSLQWYVELFNNTKALNALYTTIYVALLSTAVATVIGTLAAIGIHKMRPLARSAVLNVSNIPILTPDIVTGISMMLLFVFGARLLNIKMGVMTMILAHITFNIPYMILSVMPRLRQMNHSVYEAALDLGASPAKAYKDVIIPEIMPGIISGMLICISMSIDDFVISLFTSGPGVENLSMYIYTMKKRGVAPTANAISTIIFVVVISLLLIVNLRKDASSPGEKKLRR